MDPRAWIALCRVPGVGKVFYKRLVLRFGSPEAVFAAPEVELMRVEGARPQAVRAIKEFDAWGLADEELGRAKDAGASLVVWGDERYPANLRELHDPPPYLYVKGTLIPEDRIAVAMVGSRMATEYGRQVTGRMARELAAAGITVVSGGARGIDTEAHKGALAANGRTISVLGCGIDVVYPSENRELYEKIAEKGAVITEYPMGTPPEPGNFPKRNAIISGSSLGVIVIEAADDSGSLITANCSLEQNREVYAVPGSVSSPNSKGTNSLIKKGAKLIDCAQDVLVDLFPYMKGYLDGLDLPEREAPRTDLEPDEKTLYELISLEPSHVDTLAEKSGISVSSALSLLLGMELKGAVKQIGGMRFVREN